jgi:hypothetical protein
LSLSLTEGAGKAGRWMHPQSRVRRVLQKCTRVELQVQPRHPGFPRAMVLRLIRALPGERRFLPRSLAGYARRLDATVAAPGPHDFAVRCGVFVRHASMPDAATSIATRATFRDDRANVPHGGAGWVKDNSDLRNSQEDILDFRNIPLSSFGARARGAPERHERDARCRAARHLCNCTNLGHGTRVQAPAGTLNHGSNSGFRAAALAHRLLKALQSMTTAVHRIATASAGHRRWDQSGLA